MLCSPPLLHLGGAVNAARARAYRARATAGVTQHDDNALFSSMARRLTGQSGSVVTTWASVSNALQTGDAVLIINMMAIEVNGVRQPVDFNLSAVGIHEFARVRSVSADGGSVTLMTNLKNDYGISKRPADGAVLSVDGALYTRVAS